MSALEAPSCLSWQTGFLVIDRGLKMSHNSIDRMLVQPASSPLFSPPRNVLKFRLPFLSLTPSNHAIDNTGNYKHSFPSAGRFILEQQQNGWRSQSVFSPLKYFQHFIVSFLNEPTRRKSIESSNYFWRPEKKLDWGERQTPKAASHFRLDCVNQLRKGNSTWAERKREKNYSTRQSISQFQSLKIRRSTFPKHIKNVDLWLWLYKIVKSLVR